MKIGLNATCLNNRPSGAKQRFIGIYKELFFLFPEATFIIYEPKDCTVGSWFSEAPNISIIKTPIPSEGRLKKFLLGYLFWRSELSRQCFDIFECIHLPIVRAPTGKTILTIHDIRGIYSDYSFFERLIFKIVLKISINRADHVITVSESIKKEIQQLFPTINISIINNGIDTKYKSKVTLAEEQKVKSKHCIENSFMLAVGHLEKRKNYLCLIESMAKLRDRGFFLNLIIVGNDSGEKKILEQKIQSLKLNGSVKFLSGLTDIEVHCLYKLCKLFVFPSSYEGFGIPILEAMSAERPMVLSDLPVFREITQDQGVYFPHDDSGALATAIILILNSEFERNKLIEYGKQRIEDFSYQIISKQLLSLYLRLN